MLVDPLMRLIGSQGSCIMLRPILADPKIELIHQIDTLRRYAKRMVMKGEILGPDDAVDHKARMRDFLAIGEAYGLTQMEMVCLVLDPASQKRPECGCHSCNARKQM